MSITENRNPESVGRYIEKPYEALSSGGTKLSECSWVAGFTQ
jgi:hypothetical protein